MEVTETLSDGLKREFKVVVSATELESQVESRLVELGKTATMKGFRPGKVPLSIVRQQHRPRVLGEVLQQTIEIKSREAIEARSLRPAMQPDIQIAKFDDGEDLEFTLGLEVLPDIEIGDLSDLSLTRLKSEVQGIKIDEAIARIAEAEKRFEPVSEPRPAKEGDQLLMDFAGEMDGAPLENGSATDFEVELGAEGFIPGFAEQLVGVKPGESRTITVTFPEDFPSEAQAGKEASFKVDVKEVREPIASEIDDEMAKRHGVDDLEALRTVVKERLEQHYEQASRAQLKRALLDILDERYKFSVPPGMVEQEFTGIWQQIESDAERAGLTIEKVLEQPEDAAREEYKTIAERRVRLGLLLSEIGGQNGITIEREDLLKAALETAQSYPNPQQVLEFYRNQPDALERFRAPVFEDKVIAFLTEMADLTDKLVDPEELLRDPEEEAGAASDADAAGSTKKRASRKKDAAAGAEPAADASAPDSSAPDSSAEDATS